MKKKYIWVALFFIIVYSIISLKYGKEREKLLFEEFYKTNIYGKLKYVKIKYHGSAFKIEGEENEFVFYPYTSELNEKQIFNYFAEKEDSIYKPAFSDTLRLVKNGKVYKYTFQKFE